MRPRLYRGSWDRYEQRYAGLVCLLNLVRSPVGGFCAWRKCPLVSDGLVSRPLWIVVIGCEWKRRGWTRSSCEWIGNGTAYLSLALLSPWILSSRPLLLCGEKVCSGENSSLRWWFSDLRVRTIFIISEVAGIANGWWNQMMADIFAPKLNLKNYRIKRACVDALLLFHTNS